MKEEDIMWMKMNEKFLQLVFMFRFPNYNISLYDGVFKIYYETQNKEKEK